MCETDSITVPRIELLRVPPQKFDFLDFEELDRLLEAAKGDSIRKCTGIELAPGLEAN